MTALTTQCSWCKKVLVDGGPQAMVTHTICRSCARLYFGKQEASR